MTTAPTPFGTTPPGADDCPVAGARLPPTDFHPDSRAAQLAWAGAVFDTIAGQSDATLCRACRIVLDLSPDHALRQCATDILTALKD